MGSDRSSTALTRDDERYLTNLEDPRYSFRMTTTELPESIPFGMTLRITNEFEDIIGRITPVSAKTFRASRTNGTLDDVRRISHFRSIASAHAFILKGDGLS